MYIYIKILFGMLLSVGILLSGGCGGKAEGDKEFSEKRISYISQTPGKGSATLLETEKNEFPLNANDDEALEIEISNQDTVEVKVGNQKAYEKFIDQLEEYKEYTVLHLDLLGENVIIYLDEILSHYNFEYLSINNGGIICIKDAEAFSDNLLRNLELDHIFHVGNLEVERFTNLKFITVRMNDCFETSNGFAEILNNTSCENIIVLWDDVEHFGEKEFFEKYVEYLDYSEKWGSFKAFYKLNTPNSGYASYEFCNHVFISIKDEEKKYFDTLEIPHEMLSKMSGLYGDGQRIWLEDINFDGYKDIIFLGYNDGIELYHECIGFLWNQSKQRFDLDETVPVYFDYIDTERKRLIFTSSLSAFDDSYYIYEYINGAFEEKRLDVTFNLNESNSERITWEYYENDIFLDKLVLNYTEDGSGYYIFYGRDGSITDGTFSEEKMYSELGMQYFAEFDFYNHG